LILTPEEYARGFIDFDAVLPEGCTVELWTKTADQPRETAEWTGPYSTPKGAKVLSPPKSHIQLHIGLHTKDQTKSPVLKKVRWERDSITFIWPGPNGFNGPPGPLSLGRDYGVSYRLVFKPQRATWPEPFVVITHKARVRFWKGGIKVFDISGFRHAEPTPNGAFSVEGAVEEVEVKEDVVEVLVTIPSDDEKQAQEEAKAQVESIVGLLALCFGEQILGEPVSTNYYPEYHNSTAKSEGGSIAFPVKHLLEVSIDKNSALSFDEALAGLYESPLVNSINMALRWYTVGLGNESPVDAYIAYFVGLEALASGYFASLVPKPVRKEYSQLKTYFEETQPHIDHRLKGIVLSLISDFTLSMKFKDYWKSRFNKETSESRKFVQYNNIRGDILHGRTRVVTQDQLSSVKKLLEKLLARELALDQIIEKRHKTPKIVTSTLKYIKYIKQPKKPKP
jgi:hypothetical protein